MGSRNTARKPATLGSLHGKAEAIRFTCACGHAGETKLAALLVRNSWNTPLEGVAARARCSACGNRGVVAKPVFGDLLAAG